MIPELVAAGHRVKVLDLIGFGRSDKPVTNGLPRGIRRVGQGSSSTVSIWLTSVLPRSQDWGSLIGLPVGHRHPERFARVAIGNGRLPTGDEQARPSMREEFSPGTPELHIGAVSCPVVAASD